MKKTAQRIALAVAATVVKTLTAGGQSVTLSITGNRVTVTDGTPEARLLVTEALNIANPQPDPAGAPAPAKRKAAKGTGRGANQAGRKRGPYKRRGESTEDNARVSTDEVVPAPVAGLPATLAPFDAEAAANGE